jgi:hypothetical protein
LANLKRLFDQLDKNWDGVPGSMQRTLDNYIKRHVLLPGSLVNCDGEWRHWDLYAYRLFPVRFRYGNQEPFLLPPLQVQPLPTDYESLGYDAISRYAGTNFEHSPLFCQGFYREAGANRYTLLDKIDDAFHWAQYFSKDQYNSDGNYCGPAEPGPYFVAEVLRKRRSCLSP